MVHAPAPAAPAKKKISTALWNGTKGAFGLFGRTMKGVGRTAWAGARNTPRLSPIQRRKLLGGKITFFRRIKPKLKKAVRRNLGRIKKGKPVFSFEDRFARLQREVLGLKSASSRFRFWLWSPKMHELRRVEQEIMALRTKEGLKEFYGRNPAELQRDLALVQAIESGTLTTEKGKKIKVNPRHYKRQIKLVKEIAGMAVGTAEAHEGAAGHEAGEGNAEPEHE